MKERKISNAIFNMYEEEYNKNLILSKEIRNQKLKNSNLKYDLEYLKKSINIKIEKSVEEATEKLIKQNDNLQNKLNNALNEINRLKKEINKYDKNKDYLIDKLNNQINKNSSNSSIPTSKDIKPRTNTYNHRINKGSKNGGQYNHKGTTLTKEKLK